MKTLHSTAVLVVTTLLAGSGCAEYFTVEEACHPKGKVTGGKHLGPVEFASMERMNCHRRLSGLQRASAHAAVQAAAKGEISYIQANPDIDRVFGLTGPAQYLGQQREDPGYTGANVFERLSEEQYAFFDPGGVAVDEYIQISIGFEEEVPVGAEAIDDLMRDASWRQAILQPSWIDGSYTEAELNADWLNAAEACRFTEVPCQEGVVVPGLIARVYYLTVIHYAPHIEHTEKPVVYPKQEQSQVPVYSWSTDLTTINTIGASTPTQISYPITIGVGVIDPSKARLGDQNIFGLDVLASIVDEAGNPLETQVVLPGTEAERVFPNGYALRQAAAIFTSRPLELDSTYTLFADVVTYESEFQVDFTFNTAIEDPGVLFGLAGPVSTGSARQSPDDVLTYLVDHPDMVDPTVLLPPR